MRFPAELDPPGFLHTHWQKEALFLPGALDPGLPRISADELAWLALDPEVEARLILTERRGAATRYRVEHGPFDERRLGALPDRDWTLLVHDVDKHLPEFRAWFQVADFISDWRIDDLMVSCAAPGGSVGPHRDHYDVFLCQGSGRREWRLAGRDAVSEARRGGELRLLEPFEGEVFAAREADVLYLPPGVPHWGVAGDSCVTYSLGMRAPQRCEFADLARRLYPRQCRMAPDQADGDFYADRDLCVSEAGPGRISQRALRRARATWGAASGLGERQFTGVFGALVTRPKPQLTPDGMSGREARALIARWREVDDWPVHGMARIAYADQPSQAQLFANGLVRRLQAGQIACIAALCGSRLLSREHIRRLRASRPGRALLGWLLECGALDPGERK